jgi:hypothetical protein
MRTSPDSMDDHRQRRGDHGKRENGERQRPIVSTHEHDDARRDHDVGQGERQ